MILSAADLRNATIESTIKQLERLEIAFPEGDPIRRALTDCRREVAKHFVTKGPGGGGGLRAVK